MDEYHQGSNVESTISVVKNMIPSQMRTEGLTGRAQRGFVQGDFAQPDQRGRRGARMPGGMAVAKHELSGHEIAISFDNRRFDVKNIVICCDGTRGKYETGEKNTNVVRLFERLGADGDRQVSYYDPGIGTYSPRRTSLGRLLAKSYSSATGLGKSGAGLTGNIREAYAYLMDWYEPGDNLYLFGYSRGAHTVRVLAGMLHKCGLLTRGSNNLLPYMTRVYENRDNAKIAEGFKDSFCRRCNPHFIGVWDTVASVGWPRTKQFSNNRLNPYVAHAYQAIAVNERRHHFRVSIWDETDLPNNQEIVQVWFPGSHSDVGGQNADRGIADIPLHWMLRNAQARGLILREDWQAGLSLDPAGKIKKTDRGLWSFGAKDRPIPEGARIHKSVFQRQDILGVKYRLCNLPDRYAEAE